MPKVVMLLPSVARRIATPLLLIVQILLTAHVMAAVMSRQRPCGRSAGRSVDAMPASHRVGAGSRARQGAAPRWKMPAGSTGSGLSFRRRRSANLADRTKPWRRLRNPAADARGRFRGAMWRTVVSAGEGAGGNDGADSPSRAKSHQHPTLDFSVARRACRKGRFCAALLRPDRWARRGDVGNVGKPADGSVD
jgi:hypothetical protein